MTEIKLLKSPGCAPCEQATRIWEKIKRDYPGFELVTVDITASPAVAAAYGLMSFICETFRRKEMMTWQSCRRLP